MMQMKVKHIILLSIFLCLLVAACSPIKLLDSEADDGFRLSNYKTFDFYDVEASGDALQPYGAQLDFLQEQITQQLEQRGLRRSSESPDLKVNLGIVVAEEIQTRETNILTDPPFYVGQRRYTWKSRDVEVGRYQQGTLSLHLVDNKRNELVWQGAAQGVVPEENKAKLQKRIEEGVKKLVQNIP
ncbi:DUF4136 domain-containing protein [Pontibacter sp. H249]|uniref:DUF4136 domain-containing protein n=1 Tax=Pontibacter sp. H249 TaxID=3133420 RepID=UPI0030C32FEF